MENQVMNEKARGSEAVSLGGDRGAWVRLAVFVGLAVVTVVVCYLFPNAATNPEAGLVVWLPEEFEGMEGERVEMSEQETLWLPEDTTQLKMVYRDPLLPRRLADYRALSASLILAGSDSRSLHRPEVCMVAQGWKITQREVIRLETEGGPLEVMNLHLLRVLRHPDGTPLTDAEGKPVKQRAFYVYWWVGKNDSTPHAWQRVLRSSLNNVFKNVNDRWGYPSVMVWVDERLGERGPEEARRRFTDFIVQVAPQYQKSLGAQERVVR